MKNIIIYFAAISLVSCSTTQKQSNEVAESSPERITQKQTKPVEKEKAFFDPNSFEYFLQLTDYSQEIPRNLVEKFIGTKWEDEDDSYRRYFSEETKHYKIFDIYVITFRLSMFGVANATILATYTNEGAKIADIEVSQSSDRDQTSPHWYYRGFRIVSDSLVQVYDGHMKAKKYDHMMPDSLHLFDLDSSEVIETVKYTNYVIQKTGEFKEVHPIRNLLKEEDLKKLSKQELRIKRNWFFARLGYIFKSDDLKEHFEQTNWYEPLHENVTDKLTAFDIYNINLLKELEDSK